MVELDVQLDMKLYESKRIIDSLPDQQRRVLTDLLDELFVFFETDHLDGDQLEDLCESVQDNLDDIQSNIDRIERYINNCRR